MRTTATTPQFKYLHGVGLKSPLEWGGMKGHAKAGGRWFCLRHLLSLLFKMVEACLVCGSFQQLGYFGKCALVGAFE